MGIMLSEISQAERDKYFMVSLICRIEKQNKQNKNRLIETETKGMAIRKKVVGEGCMKVKEEYSQ